VIGRASFKPPQKRTAMSTRVYVDNLDGATTEHELAGLFSTYGNVAGVRLSVDRTRPEPRCFGSVTMVSSEGARAAVQALNGKAVGTGTLMVSETCPGEAPASSPIGQRSPRRRASQLY
jgi:RNA recognition motif-containing protein